MKTYIENHLQLNSNPNSYEYEEFIASLPCEIVHSTGEKGLIIAVEGFDGSGKSTIARKLSALLGAELHCTPEGNFREARYYFDEDLSNPAERISFYTGSCLSLSYKLKDIRERGGIAVIDRYYYSTLSYHYCYPEITDTIREFCTVALTQPDVIVYINPDYNVIDTRLFRRGMERSDYLFLDKKHFNQIDIEYKKLFNKNVITHSNTGTPESTVEFLMEELCSLYPALTETLLVKQNQKVIL